MTFNQSGWQVQGDVYNIAGDLNLTKDSSRADMANAVDELRAKVAELEDLNTAQREEIEQHLEAAADGAREGADGPTLIAALNKAEGSLKSAGSLVGAGLGLAKAAATLGAWVAAFLV